MTDPAEPASREGPGLRADGRTERARVEVSRAEANPDHKGVVLELVFLASGDRVEVNVDDATARLLADDLAAAAEPAPTED